MRATVITDASFWHHNDTKATCTGWAAWVRVDGRADPCKKSGGIKSVPVPTAEVAEMYAAVNGLAIANALGATNVLLQTDCIAVVRALNLECKPTNALLHRLVTAMETAGLHDLQVRAKHVKGHTSTADARSYVNRWCDHNAKAHMRRLRKETGL